jgi:uncharacterized membrane protein
VRTRIAAALGAALALALAAAPGAFASHWAKNGWRDEHRSYPAKPYGYSQIVAGYGKPGPGSNTGCQPNPDSRANREVWTGADNGVTYYVYYHRKLGGSASSNMPDIRGHIGNAHWDSYVKSGIWGHNCRKIAGSSKWSTHSWGIAVDQNSRYEHVGPDHKHCHTVYPAVANTWTSHGWTHGVVFGDCMHFQYASGY